MRACVQRVSAAEVRVDGQVVGSCKQGFLILLGVGPDDTRQEAGLLWKKISHLRVFDDGDGKMNLSLLQVGGEVLVVSQFTLYASCRKGNRPSFTGAAGPDLARELYDYFIGLAATDANHVGHGVFGANMQVSLTNDGPVTIWLDTSELAGRRR